MPVLCRRAAPSTGHWGAVSCWPPGPLRRQGWTAGAAPLSLAGLPTRTQPGLGWGTGSSRWAGPGPGFVGMSCTWHTMPPVAVSSHHLRCLSPPQASVCGPPPRPAALVLPGPGSPGCPLAGRLGLPSGRWPPPVHGPRVVRLLLLGCWAHIRPGLGVVSAWTGVSPWARCPAVHGRAAWRRRVCLVSSLAGCPIFPFPPGSCCLPQFPLLPDAGSRAGWLRLRVSRCLPVGTWLPWGLESQWPDPAEGGLAVPRPRACGDWPLVPRGCCGWVSLGQGGARKPWPPPHTSAVQKSTFLKGRRPGHGILGGRAPGRSLAGASATLPPGPGSQEGRSQCLCPMARSLARSLPRASRSQRKES